MQAASSSSVRWLRVHVRSTELKSGEALRSYEVYCPRRARFVALDACPGCTHRLSLDQREKELFVACDAPDEAPGAELKHDKARAQDIAGTTVADVMARDVICVGPDVSVAHLVELMIDHAISGLPVVDESGRPLGVATKTDVVAAVDPRSSQRGGASEREPNLAQIEPDLLDRLTVAEVMTPLAFTISADTPIARAAALMAFEGIHRIPVVSDDNRVVGLLSSIDVLAWLARGAGYMLPQNAARMF